MAGHVLAPCLVMLHDKQGSMKNKPVPASLPPSLLFSLSPRLSLKGVLVHSIKTMTLGKGASKNVALLPQLGRHGSCIARHRLNIKAAENIQPFQEIMAVCASRGSETFGLLFPLLSAPASFLFLKCCIHPLPPVYVCFKRDFQRYIDHFMHLLLLFYTVEVDFLLTPGTPVQLHLLAVTGHTFLSSFDFELLNHHILGKNFEICMW